MALNQNKEVSLVLPLYRPKVGWADQFLQNREKLHAFLPSVLFSYIIVHDGVISSEMKSQFDAIRCACPDVALYSYPQNRGKGYALRYGLRRAEAPFTVLMDFDFPYLLQNIKDIIDGLEEGYDVVTGKRTHHYFLHLPIKRRIISHGYIFSNRLLFRLPVNDTQSGLKGFNEKGKVVFLQTKIDRFLVDTEFLLQAYQRKLAVKVIDVHLRPGVIFSNFGYIILKTELRNLLSLVRLQRRLKQQKMEAGWLPKFFPTPIKCLNDIERKK